MAFSPMRMRRLVSGPPTIWQYWTEDTAIKVKTKGYFEEFRSVLSSGDWIMATTSTGGVILHVEEIDPLELGPPQ